MESVLEFGALDLTNHKKSVWDIRSGQQAYDWFMCARYMNDLLTYARMHGAFKLSDTPSLIKIFDDYQNNIHHVASDLSLNFDKWCALECISNEQVSFFELGSTLFGCIEAIEFVEAFIKYIAPHTRQNKNIEWVGVDNSDYLNQTALQLHQAKNLKLFSSLSQVLSHNSVFFAKGVSLLYAINSMTEFAQIMENTDLCLFDYSFAADETISTTIGTGKNVTYYSLEQFIQTIPAGKVCYVREDSVKLNGNLLYVELIVSDNLLLEQFINRQTESLEAIKLHKPEYYELFSRCESLKEIRWLPLQECVSQFKKL